MYSAECPICGTCISTDVFLIRHEIYENSEPQEYIKIIYDCENCKENWSKEFGHVEAILNAKRNYINKRLIEFRERGWTELSIVLEFELKISTLRNINYESSKTICLIAALFKLMTKEVMDKKQIERVRRVRKHETSSG